MDCTIDEILNTPEWQWAADAESSRRPTTSKDNNNNNSRSHQLQICRRSVIARHVKLADLIGTAGEMNSATIKQDHQYRRSPKSWRKTAPFHPLHCAASQGILEDGMFFWEEAANSQGAVTTMVNTPDAFDRTPLHWAAMTDRVDFVCALLDNGADADMRDLAGRSPLFSAAAFGADRTVRVLLERGADKHGADKRGLTPLHAAAAGGHIHVAAELLIVGADPTQRSRVGATPRHVAERQGHESMVELLLIATESMDLAAVAAGTNQQQQQTGSRHSNTNTASHLMRFDWQSAMMRSE